MPAHGPPPAPAPSVLHLAPHPDDELIGPPATLMALRDAGWRVVNQACGLGSDPSRRAARAEELGEACRRAGFELRLAGPAFAEIHPDGGELRTLIAGALAEVRPSIVVSPDPGDRHPAHERVAVAAREALEAWDGGEAGSSGPSETPRWWTYGIWGPLASPTLATPFDAGRLEEILHALHAHAGELDRADYRRLVRGRAEAAAVTAPQLLFGFGNDAAPAAPAAAGSTAPDGSPAEFTELLREQLLVDGTWHAGEPRWLDPAAPLTA